MINLIKNSINQFHEDELVFLKQAAKNDNKQFYSYDNWSIQDTLHHINGWIDIAVEKVINIKSGRRPSFGNEEYAENINKKIYYNYISCSIEKTKELINSTCLKTVEILNKIGDKELEQTDIIEGFKGNLLKFILMDFIVHPVKHIAYYHLKNNNFLDFIKIIEKYDKIFMLYCGKNDQAYKFNEFFNDKEQQKSQFENFKRNIPKNELTEKIIKMNNL